MFLTKNLLDDYNYQENYLIKIISHIIYYICNIPCRILNLGLLNYFLWFSNKTKLEISPEPVGIESIPGKIISWNIQYGNNFFMKNTFRSMIDYLKKEKPQILLLQEVLRSKENDQIKILKEQLNLNHSFFQPIIKLNGLEIGNLILSNLEIKNTYIQDRFQVAEIEYQNKSINLCNVHLTFDITRKKQKQEIKNLVDYINKLQNPSLVAGDFNLLPFSSGIKYLSNYIPMVNNSNYTFPSNYPLCKIDYSFAKNISPRIIIPAITLSDHLPQIINLE